MRQPRSDETMYGLLLMIVQYLIYPPRLFISRITTDGLDQSFNGSWSGPIKRTDDEDMPLNLNFGVFMYRFNIST